MIVDWGAGPGGWDVGASTLGLRPVGLEMGAAECLTRAAAGHLTIRADASTWPADTLYGRLWGFICSSPCTDFSPAGKRAALEGKTGALIYETLRWAAAARPRWIAAENVKEVAPIFRGFRGDLAAMGYSVWTGVLDTANYGVPQNRKRAFLLASLDQRVAPPAPTHSRTGHDDLFGAGRLRWVSMAEALGWDSNIITGNRTELASGSEMYERAVDRPAPTVVGHAGWCWKRSPVVVDVGQDSRTAGGGKERYTRTIERPAPTVDGNAGTRWKLRHPGRSYTAEPMRRTVDEPAPTVALGHNMAEWCWERPATCIGGTPRISPPGYRGGKAAMAAGITERQFDEAAGAVKVELWELGVLQGFAADYPWRGNKTEQARQIGNAVPPPMAAALLRSLVGTEASAAA